MSSLKKCGKCGELKEFSHFHKNNFSASGLQSYCKSCKKGWYNKHLDTLKEADRNRYNKNREEVLSKYKVYYKENQEAIKARVAKYREENLEKCNENARANYKKNKEKINKYNVKWRLNRIKTDPGFRAESLIRRRILNAIKMKKTSKHYKFADLLGCTGEECYNYLLSQFTEDMTEEAFMNGDIHIDHIRPVSSFNLTDPQQQKECFHYTNLQPLWAKENLSKGSKIIN